MSRGFLDDADPAHASAAMTAVAFGGSAIVGLGMVATMGLGVSTYMLWQRPTETDHGAAHRTAMGASILLAGLNAQQYIKHRAFVCLHVGAFGVMSGVYHLHKLSTTQG